MRRLDDLHSIVQQATNGCSQEVQTLGNDLLDRFLRDPVNAQEFCPVILDAIAKLPSDALQEEAHKIHAKIRLLIADRAVDGVVAEDRNRSSAETMKRETLSAFDMVQRQGRGIVCFGSARNNPGDPMYEQAREFGRESSLLLNSTIWTGAGPGIMDASARGGREGYGKIGGIKIELSADESEFEQNVSDVYRDDEVAICTYFAPRKVGLVDACMRPDESVRTAAVFFPGGFGTLDEFFEFITLKQLNKLGTEHDVPILLMNFDGYYDNLIKQLEVLARHDSIKNDDLKLLRVCTSNKEALDRLAKFYKIPPEECEYKGRLRDWSDTKTNSK
ncbi:LOG family protein [Patescibacteria group bacterium]|nr:LOG family protein [Patescibacteria group bacterium]